MSTAVEYNPFIPSVLDDYPLDPYEFRLYARINRRGGNSSCWESIANMARATKMSLAKARSALNFLVASGLVTKNERKGKTTEWRINNPKNWLDIKQLTSLRKALKQNKSTSTTKSDTPTRFDTPTKSGSTKSDRTTPIKSDTPPLSDLIYEGTPIRYSHEGTLPYNPLTFDFQKSKVKSQKEEREEREEKENLTQEQNASNTNISVEPIDPEDYWKTKGLDLNPTPLNPNSTNTSVNQKDVTNTSLANKSCLGGKNKGDGVALNQTSVQRTTRVYDSALGINPPEKQKNLQQRFNWIPEGIWNINGKLDPNFVDWLAKDWQKAYGGDLHKKRADVLRHFKKDPANIAIAWTQYEAETRHRYENAALRMNNGVEIKPDEQQQLLSRSRAVSEKMDEQMNPLQERGLGVGCRVSEKLHYTLPPNTYTLSPNPVAVDVANPNYLTQIEGSKEENVIECHQEVKPAINSNNVGVTSSNNSSFQAAEDKQGDGINSLDSSQPSERSERVASSTPPQDIPRNEKGSAENPEAYQLWQPERLEGEQINPLQLREKLASLSQRFAMPKPIKERKPPKEPIEELNEWLADPVLRNTAMSKIMNNDFLSVEFDENGIPIQVIKITNSEDDNS